MLISLVLSGCVSPRRHTPRSVPLGYVLRYVDVGAGVTWMRQVAKVDTRNGVVTLTGQPETSAEKHLVPVAARLAWDVDGAVDVVNEVGPAQVSAATA